MQKLFSNLSFFLLLQFLIVSFSTLLQAQQTYDIPDIGWRLWVDKTASWEDDDIFLPGEYDLANLPVNPPSGGWGMLNPTTGIAVELPTTVEQHFWGQFGLRPYKDEYYFENDDDQVLNGNYLGVSWFWREIFIPADYEGKIVFLNIRGARLRAEVYLNEKLVGYNIITETSFRCDISDAIIPGDKNTLAIRITNPGGRLDWLDTKLLQWGDKTFHAGHGFGGLDRGITITANEPAYIDELWIANTPDLTKVNAHLTLVNSESNTASGTMLFEISDPGENGQIVHSESYPFSLDPNSKTVLKQPVVFANAKAWSVNDPNLYTLRIYIRYHFQGNEKLYSTIAMKDFGFRWFEADGIGDNAMLRLNGDRIRIVSAISWGFWGLNGLFPTIELADKEVKAAKSFGMNCIQFHRNIGKTEVLKAQDKLGLLRFLEPGGGQSALGDRYTLYADSPEGSVDISGDKGDAETFAEKYMEEKLLGMIRDHRSHPSVIMYCIQNEINPDLHNPRIFRLLRRMHEEDPSRIVLLKSGIPPVNQAWMQPYSDEMYYDDGSGFSGFWDKHTVGGPGVWRDEMYVSPAEFTHYSDHDSEIVMWGEMLGAAVPDNHLQMIRDINEYGGNSYDLLDHTQINGAYDRFLAMNKFSAAFSSTEELYLDIGNKCYDFWGRVIETARLSESNDFLVISGWESTAIENHSGLVDNLRNFKGDPLLLRERLAPVDPVIRVNSLVLELNDTLSIDAYLLNETTENLSGTMELSIKNPVGDPIILAEYIAPQKVADKFVYPLGENIKTPPLDMEGEYLVTLLLKSGRTYKSEERILVVDASSTDHDIERIGVLSPGNEPEESLRSFEDMEVEEYNAEEEYDLVVATTKLMHGWRSEVAADREITGTDDDILYHTESWGYYKNLEYVFSDLPEDEAEVTFYFAEVTLSGPGDRIMNAAINGQTVLKEFDITQTAGDINTAIDTTFKVETIDGAVKITIPELTLNYAKFSAIKVVSGDSVIAINCGGPEYTDKNGLVWKPYESRINVDGNLLNRVADGMPLLLLPEGKEACDAYGKILGEHIDDFQYQGHVGSVRASWMGAWYFVKANPLFKGLPVDQALKSYYQVPVGDSDGLLFESPSADIFLGYGRDHDRNIGSAGFVQPYGMGKIIFLSLPGAGSGFLESGKGIHPVIMKKIVNNTFRYLSTDN